MKPIQIGDVVGDYRVIGVAGSGGAGAVYKIEHVITLRIEAMKLLPPGSSGDPEQVRTQLVDMASLLQVEELMIVTIVHDHHARLRSYELLAQAFELQPRT